MVGGLFSIVTQHNITLVVTQAIKLPAKRKTPFCPKQQLQWDCNAQTFVLLGLSTRFSTFTNDNAF